MQGKLKPSLENLTTVSEIYDNYSTVIPADIRKSLGINENNYKNIKILWKLNEKGIFIEFYKEGGI